MLRFPFIEAAPKIAWSASRCLVSLLGGFGEQLHDDRRYRSRSTRQPVYRRYGLSRDVGVNEFHRIRSGKGESPGQHLVKRRTEGIKGAPGIDGAVHPARLLGCHIRECSGDELGGGGCPALARERP